MKDACHAVGLMFRCAQYRHTSHFHPVQVLDADDRVVEGNGQEGPTVHLPLASGDACARVCLLSTVVGTSSCAGLDRTPLLSPSSMPAATLGSISSSLFFHLFLRLDRSCPGPSSSVHSRPGCPADRDHLPFVGIEPRVNSGIPNQGFGSVRVQISGSNPRTCRRIGSTIQFPRPLRRRRAPWRARRCGNTTPNACCESR